MADSFTSDTYEALCRDAEGYLARGLAEQARELLLKATDLIGTRPRARSLLSDACMCLGLWEEAREQLEALSTLEINNIYTHFRLGQVLEELGDFELALDNYRVVAEINPGHHGAKVAIARIDKKESPEQNQENPEQMSNGDQVFPDVPGEEEEFAGAEEGVDRLLEDMGMNGRQEDAGVSELLSNMGISSREDEPKEEVRPALDLDSIFGGSTASKGKTSSKDDLAGIFQQAADLTEPLPGTHKERENVVFGGDEPIPASPMDFSAIFGGQAGFAEEEQPVEEAAPADVEASEKEAPVEAGQADFSTLFGGEEPAPAVEAAVEETVAEVIEVPGQVKEEADLSSIFGAEEPVPAAEAAVEEPVAEVVEAPGQVKEEADLSSIFGAEEPVPAVEEVVEEPVAEVIEVPGQVKEEADLSSIFGEEEPVPAAEAAVEETVAEVTEAPGQVKEEADLSSIFGAEEPVPAAEAVVEETVAEVAAAPEEVKEEADLSSIFGEEEPAPTAEAAVEETVAEVTEAPGQVKEEADLSSIFGEEEPVPAAEAAVEEPVAEVVEAPAQVQEEADLSSIFGEEEPSPGEAADELPAAAEPGVPGPAPEENELAAIFGGAGNAFEVVAVEQPAQEEPEAPSEPVTLEESSQPPSEQAVPEEPAEEAPAAGPIVEAPVQGVYTIHSVENPEISVLHLQSGSVAVRPSFVVAFDSGVGQSVDEKGVTLFSGNGTVLLGQGYESAVRMVYTDGMSARFDMLAVRPSGVDHQPVGLDSVPSLVRLSGKAEGEVMFFAAGRTRFVRLNRSMSVRVHALIAADGGVTIEEGPEGWLLISGGGRILLTS